MSFIDDAVQRFFHDSSRRPQTSRSSVVSSLMTKIPSRPTSSRPTSSRQQIPSVNYTRQPSVYKKVQQEPMRATQRTNQRQASATHVSPTSYPIRINNSGNEYRKKQPTETQSTTTASNVASSSGLPLHNKNEINKKQKIVAINRLLKHLNTDRNLNNTIKKNIKNLINKKTRILN